MKFQVIPPFYFPTTLIMIDDNQSLRNSLQVFFEADYFCEVFANPVLALDYFKNLPLPLWQQLSLIKDSQSDHNTSTKDAFVVNWRDIHRQIYNVKRFTMPSVVIVDYVMPELSGLEFCRRLFLSPIKKLMLTGNMMMDEAVAAFNDGIIDKFMKKSSAQKRTGVIVFLKNLSTVNSNVVILLFLLGRIDN